MACDLCGGPGTILDLTVRPPVEVPCPLCRQPAMYDLRDGLNVSRVKLDHHEIEDQAAERRVPDERETKLVRSGFVRDASDAECSHEAVRAEGGGGERDVGRTSVVATGVLA